MASLFAWVEFPDGRRLYAEFSTVVCCILTPLYESYAEPDTSPHGEFLQRRKLVGEPLPVRRDRPLSPPDAMIPVKVCVERDYAPWHALYCPSQHRVLPQAAFNAGYLQEYMELVEQDGLQHLVPRVWKGEHGYPSDEMADVTLCAQPVTGAILPFQRDRYDYGPGPHPEKAPERDLYAEWQGGRLCKHCLVDQRALQAIDEAERYRAAHNSAAASAPARKSFWRRLFG